MTLYYVQYTVYVNYSVLYVGFVVPLRTVTYVHPTCSLRKMSCTVVCSCTCCHLRT